MAGKKGREIEDEWVRGREGERGRVGGWKEGKSFDLMKNRTPL